MPKVGTQPPPSLKAADCAAAARGALEKSDLRLAKRALDLAAACARKEKGAAEALAEIDTLRKLLEAMQDRLLAEAAKDAAAGKHFEALKRYHSYVRKYEGLRIASVAAAKIGEARKDPDLRSANARAESEAAYDEVATMLDVQWQTTLAAAPCGAAPPPRPADADIVASATIQQQAAILKLLEAIRKDHPDTAAATKAAALDKAFRTNKQLVQAIEKWQADQDARGLFLKASFYESAQAKDKATDAYRQLLEKYPSSTYAATARRKLKLVP